MSSIVTFIFSLVNVVLRGIVINIFWGWFIQSQFGGAPDISITGAIGLSLFVDVVMPHRRLSDKELKEELSDTYYRDLVNCYYYFLGLILVLVFGLIIHWMM